MEQFISDWQNICFKAKKVGCDFSDTILAFKLLQDANLSEMDIKLVLTGVDYSAGKTKKDLLDQLTKSLKKFKGRSVMAGNNSASHVDVKVEPTWLTADAHHVLVSSGWMPPAKGPRRRSRSVSPQRSSKYLGKKNRLGSDFLPIKCHLCRCHHTENCNCPCRYHLQDYCPSRRTDSGQKNENNTKLSFFMNTLLGDKDGNLIL
jgi:hypothetical protein